MAQVTLSDLFSKVTKNELLQKLLDLLGLGDFPATSWYPESVPRRILVPLATMFEDVFGLAQLIATSGFLDHAKGPWLKMLATNFYRIYPKESVFARGTVRLTAVLTSPGATIVANQLRFRSTAGLIYKNTTGGVLSPGGFLDVTVEAESPGASYNAPIGTLRELMTPIPGVTANNPGDVNGIWLTQVGADEEDEASIVIRCKARFPELGGGATDLVYRGWALSGSAEVRRARVFEGAPKDGQVKIVVSGQSAGVSGTAVTDVLAYVQPRRPQCVKPNVLSASVLTVSVSATLLVQADYEPTALAQATQKLIDLQNTIDIGGTVYRARIIDVLMEVDGAINVLVPEPVDDFTPPQDSIVALTPTIVVTKSG